MPKHIVRLVLLVVLFGAVALAARYFFVDKSYYEYGSYRGKAVTEIARDKPVYQGAAYCKSCHAAQVAEWSKGVHDSSDTGRVVKCEVCHGPGGGRDPDPGYIHAATGPIHPKNLKLTVPTDTRALCTLCHEKLPARPPQQAQIVIEDHAGTQQCTLCHRPHSPRTIVGALAPPTHPGNAAAGKGKVSACADCHGAGGISMDLPGPTLAGQNETYLAAALKAYKSGKLSDEMMAAIAADMNDSDIADVAAYFAALKCDGAPNAAELATAARKAGASVCTDCHGANGISPGRLAPNLVGQSKAYLADALKAYASGKRPSGVMSALTKGMGDAEVEKMAAYYAGFSCN